MDYLIYKLLAPITAGFILLSVGLSIGFLKEKISRFILYYELSVLLYLILNYCEFMSRDLGNMLIFAKMEHVSLMLIAISWFSFALFYSGFDEIVKKPVVFVIGLIALLNTVAIFTNDSHNLFYLGVQTAEKYGNTVLLADYGPLFWPLVSYNYVLLIAGGVLVTVSFIKGGSYYHSQAIFVLHGFLLPLVVNIIYIFRLIPGFDKDFSSVTFALTGLFIFIGINRFRLLHFSPISRNLIMQMLEDIIITLDCSTRIIDYNKKAAEVFALIEPDLGKKVERTVLFDLIGSLLSFGIDSEDTAFIKEFGSIIYNIRIKKIFTDKNNYKGIVLTMSDVTDKMKLIKDLDRSNHKLNDMQVQLYQHEKMAALGQLSAGVAHEINNPLSFIKSNMGVMERYSTKLNGLCSGENHEKSEALHKLTEEIEDIVKDSNEGINRIADVVKNLLEYSKKDIVGENLYNINNGIESTLVLARNIIKHKAILELDLGDVPDIKVKGNEINQIILNLLTNAAQAIPEEGMTGIISIKTFTEFGNLICEISDNGAPIAKENRELLFESFFTTKGLSGGTGIGLSISRTIIEKGFDGRLYLKDSDKKIFRIEIPLDS